MSEASTRWLLDFLTICVAIYDFEPSSLDTAQTNPPQNNVPEAISHVSDVVIISFTSTLHASSGYCTELLAPRYARYHSVAWSSWHHALRSMAWGGRGASQRWCRRYTSASNSMGLRRNAFWTHVMGMCSGLYRREGFPEKQVRAGRDWSNY